MNNNSIINNNYPSQVKLANTQNSLNNNNQGDTNNILSNSNFQRQGIDQ